MSFERLPELVNGNAALMRRGRFLSVDFLLGVGDDEYLIEVRAGHVAGVKRGPFVMRPGRFAIHAGKGAWSKFWAKEPPPGFHDIFAMTKSGAARIDGDLHPLMANLRYVKDLLEAPRARA
jgi:hypothetical protein